MRIGKIGSVRYKPGKLEHPVRLRVAALKTVIIGSDGFKFITYLHLGVLLGHHIEIRKVVAHDFNNAVGATWPSITSQICDVVARRGC